MGQLKAKLAKLRRELLGPQGGGGGGGGLGFDVARTGIATVGFVGFPSVGKVRYLRRVIVGCSFSFPHLLASPH